MYTHCRHTCIASGMLSIVGERESAHAKLEARTYIRHYSMDSAYIYIYIYLIAWDIGQYGKLLHECVRYCPSPR